ncbi:MAG TPA: thioredoxin-disulfide reductase [Cyanobacteria bacterium UBA9971]|nr:thioredoxin-disulfide reductase [Cyanobacteria bacterium UBA9971]
MTQKELNYDLLILGGGPAGLTAALYGGRGLLKTAIVDTGVTGGQLTNILEIENYPGFPIISGYDLVEKIEEHADKFNIEKFIMQEIKKVDLVSPIKTIETTENIFKAKTVVIATGAKLMKIGVPGEIELIGRGVSYCAVCDGAFFRDKEVCVIGGGNAAVEEALYLTRFASKVNIIHRRDALRAERMYQERAAANPKINFIWDTVVTSVNGTDKVESISVQNVKTGENSELKTDAVFPYIGYSPNTELFREQIKLDSKGFIETDINLATSCEGVFAAGDVRVSPLRQVVISAADGAISATSAVKYLEEKQVLHV